MKFQPDTTRVFFALWPKNEERSQLATWQAPLQSLCGGRMMRAETLHNTLIFLGDVAVHRLEALQLAAQEVEGNIFELFFNEARYWGHNHIVYAAPRQMPEPLAQLVDALEQHLSMHRFPFDRRDYRPHVTLLRNAHWRDAPLPNMPPLSWKITDFALVQSTQNAGLADYRVLARFPLGADDR